MYVEYLGGVIANQQSQHEIADWKKARKIFEKNKERDTLEVAQLFREAGLSLKVSVAFLRSLGYLVLTQFTGEKRLELSVSREPVGFAKEGYIVPKIEWTTP